MNIKMKCADQYVSHNFKNMYSHILLNSSFLLLKVSHFLSPDPLPDRLGLLNTHTKQTNQSCLYSLWLEKITTLEPEGAFRALTLKRGQFLYFKTCRALPAVSRLSTAAGGQMAAASRCGTATPAGIWGPADGVWKYRSWTHDLLSFKVRFC